MAASAVEVGAPAKVAQLEHAGLWVEQQVLRLDVSVADPVGVDVGQRAKQLVHVQLHTHTQREKLYYGNW